MGLDNWGDSGERGCSGGGIGGSQPRRAGGAQSVWGARELGGHWGAPRLRGGGRGGQEMGQGAGWGARGDTLTSPPLPQDRCWDHALLEGAALGGREGPGEAPGETPAAQLAGAGREEPERGPRGRLGGECAGTAGAKPGLCECTEGTICRGISNPSACQ